MHQDLLPVGAPSRDAEADARSSPPTLPFQQLLMNKATGRIKYQKEIALT